MFSELSAGSAVPKLQYGGHAIAKSVGLILNLDSLIALSISSPQYGRGWAVVQMPSRSAPYPKI
jgi:hypothetical protein